MASLSGAVEEGNGRTVLWESVMLPGGFHAPWGDILVGTNNGVEAVGRERQDGMAPIFVTCMTRGGEGREEGENKTTFIICHYNVVGGGANNGVEAVGRERHDGMAPVFVTCMTRGGEGWEGGRE
ncbi:hypothetical protein BDQ17DRAFT_1321992 [Cyathus striatus]|nr:hypothetical protein BDQ17DRAFT_1321992 [Cyathus striatus]